MLNGRAKRAELTHPTPWSRPACQGDKAKSSLMNGRKIPNEKEITATLLS
jgi:hypothetical protein